MRSQSGGSPPPEGADASPADEAWSLLTDLAFRTLRARFVATVAQLDLSPPQAQALKSLEPGRPMPMHELADHLRCDPSYVTGLVDRLEARLSRPPAAITALSPEQQRALRDLLRQLARPDPE